MGVGVGVGVGVGAGAGAGICLELEPEPKISKMGGSGNPVFIYIHILSDVRARDNKYLTFLQVQEQLDTNCLDVEDCVSTLVKLLPSHNALVKNNIMYII